MLPYKDFLKAAKKCEIFSQEKNIYGFLKSATLETWIKNFFALYLSGIFDKF